MALLALRSAPHGCPIRLHSLLQLVSEAASFPHQFALFWGAPSDTDKHSWIFLAVGEPFLRRYGHPLGCIESQGPVIGYMQGKDLAVEQRKEMMYRVGWQESPRLKGSLCPTLLQTMIWKEFDEWNVQDAGAPSCLGKNAKCNEYISLPYSL
jgi:hypothetical protein